MRLLLVAALLLLAGCTLTQDLDELAGGDAASASGGASLDGGSGGGGTGNIGGSSGGGGRCDSCVSIPAPWQGPLAVAVTPGATDCPAGYLDYDLEAFDGLEAPLSCECLCPPCLAVIQRYLGRDCGLGGTVGPVDYGACTPDAFIAVGSITVRGDSSCSDRLQATPTPIQWSTRPRFCVPPQPAACDGGYCLQEPAAGFRSCAWTEGDRSCPPGLPLRSVLYRAALDERTCEACTCTQSCEGSLTFSSFSDCGLALGSCPIDGRTCCNLPEGVTAIEAAPSGACTTTGGDYRGGSATASDPITLCCL
jgi:hypothetical protein